MTTAAERERNIQRALQRTNFALPDWALRDLARGIPYQWPAGTYGKNEHGKNNNNDNDNDNATAVLGPDYPFVTHNNHFVHTSHPRVPRNCSRRGSSTRTAPRSNHCRNGTRPVARSNKTRRGSRGGSRNISRRNDKDHRPSRPKGRTGRRNMFKCECGRMVSCYGPLCLCQTTASPWSEAAADHQQTFFCDPDPFDGIDPVSLLPKDLLKDEPLLSVANKDGSALRHPFEHLVSSGRTASCFDHSLNLADDNMGIVSMLKNMTVDGPLIGTDEKENASSKPCEDLVAVCSADRCSKKVNDDMDIVSSMLKDVMMDQPKSDAGETSSTSEPSVHLAPSGTATSRSARLSNQADDGMGIVSLMLKDLCVSDEKENATPSPFEYLVSSGRVTSRYVHLWEENACS